MGLPRECYCPEIPKKLKDGHLMKLCSPPGSKYYEASPLPRSNGRNPARNEFRLEEVATAFEALASRNTIGKVVLIP
jgi:hypothetical protein